MGVTIEQTFVKESSKIDWVLVFLSKIVCFPNNANLNKYEAQHILDIIDLSLDNTCKLKR